MIYMVINLNLEIKKAKKEFDDKNYEKVLELLDGIEVEKEYRKLVMMMRIVSLMVLKRYEDSLKAIELGIEEFPYDDFLWFRKVECHHFMRDEENALNALAEVERIVNKDDKQSLVLLAEQFEWVNDYDSALKYCDMALAIDGNFIDAVRQKAMVACSLKDHDMMNDCADKLLELYDEDIYKVLLQLMLKLFCGRYKDCLEIVDGVDVLDEGQVKMIKAGIYNQMCEDLNVDIRTSAPVGMTVDEVLNLFFKYHYDGVSHGEINGVRYSITKHQ